MQVGWAYPWYNLSRDRPCHLPTFGFRAAIKQTRRRPAFTGAQG